MSVKISRGMNSKLSIDQTVNLVSVYIFFYLANNCFYLFFLCLPSLIPSSTILSRWHWVKKMTPQTPRAPQMTPPRQWASWAGRLRSHPWAAGCYTVKAELLTPPLWSCPTTLQSLSQSRSFQNRSSGRCWAVICSNPTPRTPGSNADQLLKPASSRRCLAGETSIPISRQ